MTNLTVCALISGVSTEANPTLVDCGAAPSWVPGVLLEACKAAGGQSALARKLGLKSQGTISGWIADERIPAERVLAIEAATGVSRHRLRPDLYPAETSPPSTTLAPKAANRRRA